MFYRERNKYNTNSFILDQIWEMLHSVSSSWQVRMNISTLSIRMSSAVKKLILLHFIQCFFMIFWPGGCFPVWRLIIFHGPSILVSHCSDHCSRYMKTFMSVGGIETAKTVLPHGPSWDFYFITLWPWLYSFTCSVSTSECGETGMILSTLKGIIGRGQIYILSLPFWYYLLYP